MRAESPVVFTRCVGLRRSAERSRIALAFACALACVSMQAAAGTRAVPGAQSASAAAAPASARDADTGNAGTGDENTARSEIAALIAALGTSGCEFQRNGTWYDAVTARAHLQRKYDYLRKRDLAPTAERFIERAASRSSISGQPYRVRCPGRAEQPSADWFLQRLRAIRARSG